MVSATLLYSALMQGTIPILWQGIARQGKEIKTSNTRMDGISMMVAALMEPQHVTTTYSRTLPLNSVSRMVFNSPLLKWVAV
jgi:hypothetical protein